MLHRICVYDFMIFKLSILCYDKIYKNKNESNINNNRYLSI